MEPDVSRKMSSPAAATNYEEIVDIDKPNMLLALRVVRLSHQILCNLL